MKFEIIASPSSGKGDDSSVGDLREGLSASGQYELALGAFEEIGFDAESVREYTKQDIIYRKARTLIHTSEMSLLAKKCVNRVSGFSGGRRIFMLHRTVTSACKNSHQNGTSSEYSGPIKTDAGNDMAPDKRRGTTLPRPSQTRTPTKSPCHSQSSP